MDSSDDIDSLPIDSNEQFVASDFSNLQRVVKKRVVTTTTEPPVGENRLLRDLKIVMAATVLFLIVGHPKVGQLLDRLKMDTVTLYTIKASAFAILLFILINRAC